MQALDEVDDGWGVAEVAHGMQVCAPADASERERAESATRVWLCFCAVLRWSGGGRGVFAAF